ncbi:AAA family ATPase [Yinghuangia sp. YIM S10712]|uniref:helix-turn-helix transcriptional regulator n=1 Tax=Yinghuangia sp. YIM S10712 TaxID=3436930 RepID=UPI003F53919E
MLVERENHLAALRGMFAECRGGAGRIVVVTGPVGGGKTELAHTFTARCASSGAKILGAVGSRGERNVGLGVMCQLFCSAKLAPEQSERARELVDAFHARDEHTDRVLHQLALTLLHTLLPAEAPAVIVVDDAHFADEPSLRCLTSIVRRLRSVPVMLVLTQAERPWPTNPAFHAELPPEPVSRRMRLTPLSPRGVRALVAHEWNLPMARRLAPAHHTLTGGNPLLVRGLIEDNRGLPADDEPVVGGAYTQAFVNALYRCESSMLSLARAAAVLDMSTDLHLPARLAGLDDEAALRAAATLNRSGLLHAGRFRHRQARAAVLDDLGDDERRGLHLRAARVLRQEGATATAVAAHLLAAQATDGAHDIPMLLEAAEQALADGDTDTQLRCLRLAQSTADSARQRARTTAALAAAEWRVDPAIASRHTAELLGHARLGHLTPAEALALADRLLWFGHEAEAVETLRLICRSSTPPDPRTAAKLRAMAAFLRNGFPDSASGVHAAVPRTPETNVRQLADPYGRATGALADVLTHATRANGVAAAEQMLKGTRLEEATLAPVCVAILALHLADQQCAARSWCHLTLDSDAVANAPTWNAILTCLRARIALRQGDLPAAEEFARAALSILPVRSWGVSAGFPLGVLIDTLVGLGRLHDAAEHVNTPLPSAALEATPGLGYLHARSRFHHAGGHFEAALADAQTAGELAARWHMDHPALLDWRTEAARTAARLGLTGQARELAHDQLALLGPSDVRVRARTRHVLALMEEGQARTDLLHQAVQELHDSPARLELAHALADLGRAQQAQGLLETARRTFTEARRLSRQFGIPALIAAPDAPAEAPAAILLSDAELRVAVLAAQGHSNRQIAAELFVTVSTVEQHLTRVYRKLRVHSRSDLPLYLQTALADSA